MLRELFNGILKKEKPMPELPPAVEDAIERMAESRDTDASPELKDATPSDDKPETPVEKHDGPVKFVKNEDGTQSIILKPGAVYIETQNLAGTQSWQSFGAVDEVKVDDGSGDLLIMRKTKSGVFYVANRFIKGYWISYNYSHSEEEVDVEPA